ncbi:MAG: thioredoxin family protein [Leptospirales bacterium]|nr:thioredoxin family protein [Leptospirales bacterium]
MKNIKILGSGDADCVKLEKLAVQAAEELGLDYAIENVTSISAILSYGVVLSPGLVIDDELKVAGRIPTMDDMKMFLTEPPEAERSMGEGFRDMEVNKTDGLPF